MSLDEFTRMAGIDLASAYKIHSAEWRTNRPAAHGPSFAGFHVQVRAVTFRPAHELGSFGDPRVVCRIEALVADRDTGRPITLDYTEAFDQCLPRHEMIRHAMVNFMRHEIDECLYVDGERVRDPHRPQNVQIIPRTEQGIPAEQTANATAVPDFVMKIDS